MTIKVVKAGAEALVKSNGAKGAISQVVNRAVTAEEAPYVTPARESTKVTLMPWKGWFQRWLRDFIGEEKFKKFREAVFFYPEDDYDLHPIKPGFPVSISDVDPNLKRIYRYPSPASEGPVKLPVVEEGEDPFDLGYYKKDTKRRWAGTEENFNPYVERLRLSLMDQNDPAVQEEIKKLDAGPQSSKGNGGVFATGKSDFDPTGLRATMSANWKALNESLDKHMPDHLPTYCWAGREEEEAKHYLDRGVTPPLGAYYMPLKQPVERRIATW